MKAIYIITCILCTIIARAQEPVITLSGTVMNASNKEPLRYASVTVKNYGTVTGPAGTFELAIPLSLENDTVSISYVGFKTASLKAINLASPKFIFLDEFAVVLQELTVTYHTLNLKQLIRALRPIKGNLYAMEGEVTNGEYNAFLNQLRDSHQEELLSRYEPDLSRYDKNASLFFQRYGAAFKGTRNKDTVVVDHSDFPVVNIRYEAANAYCAWLTDQYNFDLKKKKFRKVKFRLPTLKEWQIAALGYSKFQSWNLLENTVEVIIPTDTAVMEPFRGPRKTIPVDKDILYPWYVAYHYRNKPQNALNCFLGNFKVVSPAKICFARNIGYDGFTMMGRTKSYFPNNMGLFDVVGNVAEMISENGKACGGSWDDLPSESTIQSVKSYSYPDASIGFRVFMEVVEP